MAHLTIFCDACILYPAPIRDLLMVCALNDLLQLKWSDRVLNEWLDNLIKNRPDLSRERLEKTKYQMNKAILDCKVYGYEAIEMQLELPDENDRHVLAAAIITKANFIVTANLKDFPDKYLSKFEIQAIHPDKLFLLLIEINEETFLNSVKECQQKLRKPPQTLDKYIANLNEKCHLVKTASFIRDNKAYFTK